MYLNSTLSILQWNCNSLTKGAAEFIKHIGNKNEAYDVICLQETFLKPGKHFRLLGHNIVRRDREDAKGGLITFVKEGLNFSEVTNELENITVKLNIKGSCLQVINIYIPAGKIVEKTY